MAEPKGSATLQDSAQCFHSRASQDQPPLHLFLFADPVGSHLTPQSGATAAAQQSRPRHRHHARPAHSQLSASNSPQCRPRLSGRCLHGGQVGTQSGSQRGWLRACALGFFQNRAGVLWSPGLSRGRGTSSSVLEPREDS